MTMNKVEMQNAIAIAMSNDNVVDAREMSSIVAQVRVHDIMSFEINAARSLLRDGNAEVAADTRELARATRALSHATLAETPNAIARKSAAEAALVTAQNRASAYQTLSSTLNAEANPAVLRTANDMWDAGRGLEHAGHVIVDGAQNVGDRVGSAVSHAGEAAGQIFRDLFGHH